MNKYQHNSLCFIYKHVAKLRRHLPTNLGWLINSWIWNYNLIMLLACILRIERNRICGNDHSAWMRHGWVGTLFRFTVLQPTLGWHSAAKKKRIGVPKNSDMRGFNAESLKIHISSTHTHKRPTFSSSDTSLALQNFGHGELHYNFSPSLWRHVMNTRLIDMSLSLSSYTFFILK